VQAVAAALLGTWTHESNLLTLRLQQYLLDSFLRKLQEKVMTRAGWWKLQEKVMKGVGCWQVT